jgi:acetyltransferase-like isoleucine patch superfamily enzyme
LREFKVRARLALLCYIRAVHPADCCIYSENRQPHRISGATDIQVYWRRQKRNRVILAYMKRLLDRVWRVGLTRMLWGWRLYSLGDRCVIQKCRWIPNPKAVSIGHDTLLSCGWQMVDLDPSRTGGKPKMRIGSHCRIMPDFQCNASISVELQDYVLVAPRVFVTDSDHVVGDGARTTLSHEFRSAPVIIEHDCWLGVNAVILKGVRIGHHSIVGANAVVTRDVEPHTIVAGIPAKPIGRIKSNESRPVEQVKMD